MNDLSNTIYTYYLDHFADLPMDKQFHFASRLHLWCQDPAALALLNNLRGSITHEEDPEAALREIIQLAQQETGHGSKNAAELRRPYFERYPMLKTYVSVLFRIIFLKTLYDVDARSLFFTLFERSEIEKFEAELLTDHEAIAILSTHAINFFYLYERIIKQQNETLPLETFLEIGKTQYDHANVTHLQLLIYLYTHCIIGESMFYFRKPSQNPDIYLTMLHDLEALIVERFVDINLDNKFEFLACAKIMGYRSHLEQQIFDEAAISISDEGTFLIDRHNNNPQIANTSLDKSEHRNVLCILASRDFKPLGS